MRIIYCLEGIMLMLLAGCAMGPDYQRPDQQLPETYYQQDKGQEESLADMHWRSIYTDEKLQLLITEALSAAPDLLVAEARVEEAEATLGMTRSELFPQLGLSWTTTPIARLDDQHLSATYTGGAAISWELDLWGRLRRANEASKASLLASEANRRALRISLIGKVANLYYQLVAQRQSLVVAKETAANQKDALYLVQRLSHSGISCAAEERQQEVALAVTEASLPTIRENIVASENALSILLGRVPGTVPVITKESTTFPTKIPAGLPSSLLERRPDLVVAEQNLVAANARVGEAKAMFFPDITLTGLFGGLSTTASDFLSGGTSTVASLGADALQPLFAGGYYKADYHGALARLDQAIITYRKTVLAALAEVSNALAVYRESGQLIEVQKRRVIAAKESLRLADKRYRAGVISFIEVLDAQRQLFDAKTAQVESEMKRKIALSSIYLALGGGWVDEDEPNQDSPVPK